MLLLQSVRTDTLALLQEIRKQPFFDDFILVGGTALALHLGHRLSIDLDFFTLNNQKFEEIKDALAPFQNKMALHDTKKIKVYNINEVKVDFVNYIYPWLEPIVDPDGLRIASLKDIAAMKIAAITNRGTKKDFVDMNELLKHFEPKQLLGFYAEKYHDSSRLMALKRLMYFQDAEEDAMPEMLQDETWIRVKKNILNAFSGIA